MAQQAVIKEIASRIGLVYDFFKDHWGELIVVGHIAAGFLRDGPPPEDAPAVAKMVHGGKHSIDDEIIYEAVETHSHVSKREQDAMRAFRKWMKIRCGDDIVGKRLYADWDNAFRGMVIRMRKDDEDITKPVRFIKRLVREMCDGWENQSQAGDTSVEETLVALADAGFMKALEYLDSYNMPSGKPTAVTEAVRFILKKGPIDIRIKYELAKSDLAEHAAGYPGRRAKRTGFIGTMSRLLTIPAR